jgi:hypothetical protein
MKFSWTLENDNLKKFICSLTYRWLQSSGNNVFCMKDPFERNLFNAGSIIESHRCSHPTVKYAYILSQPGVDVLNKLPNK